jgi:hypothetical protein
VLDPDRFTVGMFGGQAPQPHPAVGVHCSTLIGRRVLGNDETTRAASDSPAFREAAMGG